MKKMLFVLTLVFVLMCTLSFACADNNDGYSSPNLMNNVEQMDNAHTTQNAGFDAQAFAEAFDQGILTLKKLELPGTEDIRWISISPKGSYLFGYQQDQGCGIYDIVKQQFTLFQADTTEDIYGDLNRVMKHLTAGWLNWAEVVWSTDEKYFAITNYNEIVGALKSIWDLFIGDVNTKTIRVLQTWPNKFRDVEYATAINPRFGEDAGKLYYILQTRSEKEMIWQTYEYDIATGKSVLLFANSWYPNEDGRAFRPIEGFFQLNDTQFMGLIYNPNGYQYGLQLHYQDGDSWGNTRLMSDEIPEIVQGEDEFGITLSYSYRLRKIDDKHFALLTRAKSTGRIRNSLLFRIDENNQLVKMADTSANNIQPSPDGQYLLSARYDSDPYLKPTEAWGLWASRTEDQYNGIMREIKITLPDSVAQSLEKLYYLEGIGTPAGDMDYGFQWGGNYVLLSPTDVCYFDKAVDTSEMLWTWNDDLTGTKWVCTSSTDETLNFLENGTFEMFIDGEMYTGEYLWTAVNTVALTVFDETILCVTDGNLLHADEEERTYYLVSEEMQNQGIDLTGTSWESVAPVAATLRFIENGTFEMVSDGEMITGEYQWIDSNTVAFIAFEEAIMFILDGNTLYVEEGVDKFTFYLEGYVPVNTESDVPGANEDSEFICTSCRQEQLGTKYESSYTLGGEKIVLCQSCYEALLTLIGY